MHRVGFFSTSVRASRVYTSRWLVGSSRISRLISRANREAWATLAFSPPESTFRGLNTSSPRRFSRARMVRTVLSGTTLSARAFSQGGGFRVQGGGMVLVEPADFYPRTDPHGGILPEGGDAVHEGGLAAAVFPQEGGSGAGGQAHGGVFQQKPGTRPQGNAANFQGGAAGDRGGGPQAHGDGRVFPGTFHLFQPAQPGCRTFCAPGGFCPAPRCLPAYAAGLRCCPCAWACRFSGRPVPSPAESWCGCAFPPHDIVRI